MPSSTDQIKHASPLSAETPETLYEKGTQCVKNRYYVQAAEFFQQCLRLQPGHIPALISLGIVLNIKGLVDASRTTYRKALKLSPNHPEALKGIGNYYRAVGEFDKAAIWYGRALKARPDDAGAMYDLIRVRPYRLDSSLAKDLQRLYGSAICTGLARALVCFALASIHEDHDDPHRAFRYYAEANAAQFPLAGYDEQAYAAMFEALEAAFTGEFFHRLGKVGRTDDTPIFVLGMPRSGSSLVEQILASHSGVYGVGEASILPWIAEQYIPQTFGVPFPAGLVVMNASVFGNLGDLYLQQLATYCPGKADHIVAKTPNNFFLIGLIRLLFPRAVIIHCVRDPMDTCWSLFRHYFGTAHGYSYNQLTLGRYYRRYQRLMDHWHKVLPGEIHDVRYEELVEQPEKAIRALLDYCGLPWEDKCLHFYRTKRVVNTASFAQVRRPIYKTSIKSWLPVADELAPLRAALEGR